MSYKSLKLTRWFHPEKGERIYINSRFCEWRSGLQAADSVWIEAKEDGSAVFGFKASRDFGFCEDRALAMSQVKAMLENVSLRDQGSSFEYWSKPWLLTFAEIVERVEACKTKGGNFSMIQYEKKFC